MFYARERDQATFRKSHSHACTHVTNEKIIMINSNVNMLIESHITDVIRKTNKGVLNTTTTPTKTGGDRTLRTKPKKK